MALPLPRARASRPVRQRLAATATLTAAVLLLSGCGSSGPVRNSPADLRARLPEAIRKAGVIKVGSDLSYAPVESKGNDGAAVGIDPDIAAAIGRYLGLKLEFVDSSFGKLIPALQAHQVDVVMSAMNDTKQRREGTDVNSNKVNPGVDFVDYFIAGTSIIVQKGNPKHISTLDSLCGQTVAIKSGTIQASMIDRQQGACQKVGKVITVHLYDTDPQALDELAAGRSVADLNDFPVAALNAQTVQGGKAFEIANAQIQPGPYGIAVAKDNTQLRDVMLKAVAQVLLTEEYTKILAKWGVSAGAAKSAVINGGY